MHIAISDGPTFFGTSKLELLWGPLRSQQIGQHPTRSKGPCCDYIETQMAENRWLDV